MVFTQAQIQDMLSILTRYQLTFILNQLGPTYLTAVEKALLTLLAILSPKVPNLKRKKAMEVQTKELKANTLTIGNLKFEVSMVLI